MRDALRDMPEIADNGVELDALAALSAEQQAATVVAVKSGRAPSVRAAITTTAQPTEGATANADSPLDAILEIDSLSRSTPSRSSARRRSRKMMSPGLTARSSRPHLAVFAVY